MQDRITQAYRTVVFVGERVLALAVLIGAVVFALGSVPKLAGLDWTTTAAFYDLVYRVLLLVIALGVLAFSALLAARRWALGSPEEAAGRAPTPSPR